MNIRCRRGAEGPGWLIPNISVVRLHGLLPFLALALLVAVSGCATARRVADCGGLACQKYSLALLLGILVCIVVRIAFVGRKLAARAAHNVRQLR